MDNKKRKKINKDIINNYFSQLINRKKLKGNTLLLTMFIMAGMIIVASSGSYLALLAIRAGSVQSQSTKAYFLAESGAERLLYEIRKGTYSPELEPDPDVILFENLSEDFEMGGGYKVFHIAHYEMLWRSAGEFENTKRGVEIEI
ncbi:MAG: hypothetical protein PF488_04035 [Patescibacteria group bacterium]|jgi:hypothetical protein|nr:hypothetical protein [Patescibacteria group bacterium]